MAIEKETREEVIKIILDENNTEWEKLIDKYQKGTLFKADIVNKLRSNNGVLIVPRAAMIMLADILDGDGKMLRQGRRPRHIKSITGKDVPAADYVIGYIDIRKDIVGLQQAKLEAQHRFGVSMRSIEEWRRNDTQ